MRSSIVVLCGLWAGALPAVAQTYPAEMAITMPEVEVRSGPSTKFYPTAKLYRGAKVKVVRASKQEGWLEIEPPPGSFSWINQRYVEIRPNGQMGTVNAEVPVSVLPGSSVTNTPPDVEQIKVERGTVVVILDHPLYAQSGVWLPIAPQPREVRYIPAQAVDTKQLAGTATPSAVPVVNASLASMNKAASPSGSVSQPAQPARISPTPAGGWQPTSSNSPPTTSLYATGAAPAANQPQWSVWGLLRKTGFQKDGQTMYMLESRQGQPLLYVATKPGFSLGSYVGREVSLYGSVSYIGELRIYSMTATHVALP
jgi:uncharacterized protein YraI